MDRQEFCRLNNEHFQLVIEVSIPQPDKKIHRYLPESFTCDLGEDPRKHLKARLLNAIDLGEISPEDAHEVMRHAKFNLVPDLGGKFFKRF
jgi:hypothetical protein